MSSPFSLLGVDGLLLPGTEERPCPWFSNNKPEPATIKNTFEYGERIKSFNWIAEQAATAACWYLSNATIENGDEDAWQARIDQHAFWQLVFERACERMRDGR